ncbi:MAG: hypothetical protein ACYC96_12555 [Fimbriimonadaceae bacterium]
MRKDVGKELKLTDDEASKIRSASDDISQQRRQAFQDNQGDMAAVMKAMTKLNDSLAATVKGTLTDDQFKRLLEIYVQRAGIMAVTDANIQKNLKLTDSQIKDIKDLQDKQNEANRSLFEKVRSGEIDRADVGAMMQKNTDALKADLGKVLTDDQRAQFKTMGGTPFTFDPAEPFGGFGRRAGGGGGGGGN